MRVKKLDVTVFRNPSACVQIVTLYFRFVIKPNEKMKNGTSFPGRINPGSLLWWLFQVNINVEYDFALFELYLLVLPV